MRKALQEREGERATFSATFERFGIKNGYRGPQHTILLTDVCDATGTPVCDHLWFNLTQGFEELALEPGDRIQFDARVKKYVKGYLGRREDVYAPVGVDYKLSYPTKISIMVL